MISATTSRKLSANGIARTLVDVYGVTALYADPIHIEWAASRFAETSGVDAAAKALREINRIRETLGKQPSFPRYGTPLFGAY
jgi:hypothetical protein